MSEIRANTISDAAGTGPVTLTGQYASKAWINFNGTGTVAIRDSENVASLTDLGAGDYRINFTSAMGSIDYALSGIKQNAVTNADCALVDDFSSRTTTLIRVVSFEATAFTDSPNMNIVLHGDLA